MNTHSQIRPKIVKLISRLLRPLTEEGVLSVSEEKEILTNLKHLADKGTLAPPIVPKLVDMNQAAEMLGIGISNFKKLERDGAFPFKRRLVGSSVRFRNTDIIEFIMFNQN